MSMTIPSPRPLARRHPLARDPSPDARRRAPVTTPKARVLEVVEPARRWRLLRRRVLLTIAGLAVVATPFALVLVHVELTANEARLTSLQAKGDVAQEQYEKLRLSVAQLASPSRVVATAQQLGMVSPPAITYIPASPGAVVSPAGPTMPAALGVASWTAAKQVDLGR